MVAQQDSSGLEVPLYLVINIEGKGKGVRAGQFVCEYIGETQEPYKKKKNIFQSRKKLIVVRNMKHTIVNIVNVYF